MHSDYKKVEEVLKKDGVAIIPTDTIYGLIARAQSKKAVAKVYKVKGRDDGKPCIILITAYSDLKLFGVDQKTIASLQADLKDVWPGKVSVIMPTASAKYEYLHRGTHTLAFRMVGPRNRNLYSLIKNVGPLVAPSANPQGKAPAIRKSEARAYFGNTVDAYICGGTRISKPSTLVEYKNGAMNILRQGAVIIKQKK